MIYAFIGGGFALLVAMFTAGYFLGLYQAQLVDKIRTLEGKVREAPEPAPEPQKPTVAGGAYQPPREVSTTVEKKQKAGLVETKTPELLDWESSNELARLEHGG